MNTFSADRAIFEAPKHKTMAALARELGTTGTMLTYNLGKARKLELVRTILGMNKGVYKWDLEKRLSFVMANTSTVSGNQTAIIQSENASDVGSDSPDLIISWSADRRIETKLREC